ncbi:tetratricopeptide repeat protein [Sulfurivermis fontis]|uniref:tetratricopeptide repeat protein n=1 Tax=Sulfurivermis fontis TaxID=1972068 RepID=UPI000FD9CDD2|nr:SEL1-like repeat protein [Sulfurivermis fontis]
MKRYVLLLLLLAAPALADSIDEAAAALDAGDHSRALLLLRPLARDGNMDAQYLLGSLYSSGGNDVAQDGAEAVKWLTRAAEQGHQQAANTLGMMYVSGLGVKMDETEAKKWFALAGKIAEASNKSSDCE